MDIFVLFSLQHFPPRGFNDAIYKDHIKTLAFELMPMGVEIFIES